MDVCMYLYCAHSSAYIVHGVCMYLYYARMFTSTRSTAWDINKNNNILYSLVQVRDTSSIDTH